MSVNLSQRASPAGGFVVGVAALLSPFVAGCSAGAVGAPQTPGPSIDANAIAVQALEANRIPRTSRLRFGWTLREPNLNVSGEGVVRVQPPDRARLDLFLNGDASVLAVALVSDELRMPPGAPRQIVPSAPLLWAAFGIFRPGHDSTLLGGDRISDGVVRLRYLLADGQELHYRIRDRRVIGVEMLDDGDVVHRVDLRVDDADELPQEATYRNIAAFRELKVTVASIEDVDTYPDRIWRPGR